jgi:hypothetical protein
MQGVRRPTDQIVSISTFARVIFVIRFIKLHLLTWPCLLEIPGSEVEIFRSGCITVLADT